MKINILKNPVSKFKNIKFDYTIIFEILVALLALTITYSLISIPFEEQVYVWILLFMWLGMLIYSLLDYKNRIFLTMFLISFFNFLIGRSLLITLNLYDEYYIFSDYANIQGQKIVVFSFVIFSISYYFIDKYFRKNGEKENKNYESKKYISLRKISKVLFYIFYLFMIYTLILKIYYVYKHGYPSVYLDKTANVNFVLRKAGSIAPLFFFFFLSTMPSKKEIKIPLILWLFYLSATLLIGARFSFVIGIFTIFTYVVIRNFINSDHEQWITKKQVFILIIIGLFLLVFFAIYKDFRFGNKIKDNSLVQFITDFFYEQGVNINNNKRIFQFENNIPKNRIYSFNSITSFWDRNINSRLMGEQVISGNNLNRAYNENSLSDMLAVLVLGEEKYLSGLGVGSSYIAEIYHDFSWLGLIVVNILYAFILNSMQDSIHRGPISFVITIRIFMGFLKVPRANADLILLQVIDPVLWFSIFTMKIASKFKVSENSMRYNSALDKPKKYYKQIQNF